VIGLFFLACAAAIVLWLLIVQPEIVLAFLLPAAFMAWMAMGFPQP